MLLENTSLYTEEELFLRIANGDETAFSPIFHRYNAQLYPAVLKILKSEAEAEEIVQNTFLKLWLNRHQLPGIAKPGAWLFRIASNLALNALRDQHTYRRYTAMINHYSTEDEVEQTLHARELTSIIAEAVKIMPAACRQVFRMSRYDGMNRQEIAQQLGISESTVKNQLTASLKFVQQYVKRHGIQLPLIFFTLFS